MNGKICPLCVDDKVLFVTSDKRWSHHNANHAFIEDMDAEDDWYEIRIESKNVMIDASREELTFVSR